MSGRPAFPAFRDRTLPEHTYALLLGTRLIDEHGHTWTCPTLQHFTQIAAERGLVTLTHSIAHHPYLAAVIAAPDAHCYARLEGDRARKQAVPNALAIAWGKQTLWILRAETWGLDPLPESLAAVREAVDMLGLGARTTPGSLGQAAMRALYPPPPEPRLRRLEWRAWADFHRTLVGQRSELYTPGIRLPLAYQLDMRAAYPWAAQQLPAGDPVYLDGPDPRYPIAYHQCVWSAADIPARAAVTGKPGPRALPVAPVRDKKGDLHWGVPGTHSSWLWTEEIDAMRQRGDTVEVGRGWGFRGLTDALTPWAEYLFAARDRVSPDAAGIVKGAAVAGLGRCGMDATRWELTGQYSTGDDQYVDSALGRQDVYVHPSPADDATLLIQCASYVHMRVRMATYRRACIEEAKGALLATNVDAVLTRERPTESASEARLGMWKATELRNLYLPATRHLLADGIRKTPGVPHEREIA